MKLLVNFLLLLTVLGHGAYGEEESFIESSKSEEEIQNMIHWMEAAGGFLDSRVEIRRWNPEDPTSYFGVFVSAPIQENEVLMRIPVGTKIQLFDDGNDWEYDEQVCELSWMLKAEFEEGNKSKYLPYINYLRTQAEGQIPGAWSSAGQSLLLKVHGDLRVSDGYEEEDSAGLVNWLDAYANEECAIGDKTLDSRFIALTVQRGYDSVLIPLYDMVNHSNHPEKINTITDSSIYGENGSFTVHALRDLQAGEELHYSYHDCPDCGDNTMHQWGTPEMLRDFGFVEGYPHRFHLSDDRTIFVDEIATEDGLPSYVASCKDENCPEKSWIEEKVQRLMDVEESISEAATKSSVPTRELAVIRDYHKALLVAFSAIRPKCLDPATATA